MSTPGQRILRVGLLLLPLAGVGCGGMGRFDVEVTLEHRVFQTELATIPSVEVNLIGVNISEQPVWNSYSMTKYWTPDDPLRTTAVKQEQAKVLTFGDQPPFQQSLSRTNIAWDTWRARGAAYLFAVVNYPRSVPQERAGDADARRVERPYLGDGRALLALHLAHQLPV